MRSIIDWDYYIERVRNTIQKMLVIPAVLQKIKNPVPRLAIPDWLNKYQHDYENKYEQKRVTNFFKKVEKPTPQVMDLEDVIGIPSQKKIAFDSVKNSTQKSDIKNYLQLNKPEESGHDSAKSSKSKSVSNSQNPNDTSLLNASQISNPYTKESHKIDGDFD